MNAEIRAREGEEDSENPLETPEDAIAVIGMAGRFPGADTVEAFWKNLLVGVEGIRRFSDAELERLPFAEASEHPDFVAAGAPLERVHAFDYEFFGMKLREAQAMDPQLRHLLEVSWEAIEDAAYDVRRLPGKVAVFCGTGRSLHDQLRQLEGLSDAAFAMAALGRGTPATRIAHELDLRGAAVQLHTACSTGLVAVHLACESLLLGSCDVAIAAAASITPFQRLGYVYREGMILSRDGHCRAYDADASGTVGGSAAAAVLLKPLRDALADGDPIHGVILGSATNNDGRNKVGFTAPGVEGQTQVIVEALELAGVHPESIGFVEGHGTGTRLGDPIEVRALTRAYREHTDAQGWCALGSVKSNLGHLDTVAGLAGLMKALLAARHGVIPPTLHFQRPNPELDLGRSPFFVNVEPVEWSHPRGRRRAAVSSLGIGGTNAHAIVEAPPALDDDRPADEVGTRVFLLSARNPAVLDDQARRLAAHLNAHPELEARDVAATLLRGRTPWEHRAAWVVDDTDALARQLEDARGRRGVFGVAGSDGSPSVAFVFPGQAAQYPGMGRRLYARFAPFREHFDRLIGGLDGETRPSVRALVLGAAIDEEQRLRMQDPALALPAIYALELAVARTLEEWGIRADECIGHSYGEYVAAVLCGVMSEDDGLRLAVARGELMAQMPAGAMLAVPLPVEELRRLLPDRLSLAGVNAEESCVVSGRPELVEDFERELAAEGVASVRLATGKGFHSEAVECLMEPLEEVFRSLELSPPRRPYISCVTGERITADQATDPVYWAQQMREPVMFAKGLDSLAAAGRRLLLEVGPGKGLTGLARRHWAGASDRPEPVAALGGRRNEDEAEALLRALAELWCIGADIDWESVLELEQARRVRLPAYAFQQLPVPAVYRVPALGGGPSAGEIVVGEPAQRKDHATTLAEVADPPRSEVEKRLAEMWRRRIGVDAIGVEDDFFDLGGSSLIGAQILADVRSELGVKLTLADVFDTPTLAAVAARIEELRSGSGAGTSSAAVPSSGGASEAHVRVRHPETGEIRAIPVERLEEALRRGLEQVDE